MLALLRESLADTFDVLGELGADASGTPLYLAREFGTDALVSLAASIGGAQGELTVDVHRTLGRSLTISGNVCPECGTVLEHIEPFCVHCGADLAGMPQTEPSASGESESTRLLNAMATELAGTYEILGTMETEGRTGLMYFARTLDTGRITALRLRRAVATDATGSEFVVNETQMMRVAPIRVAPMRVAPMDSVSAPMDSAPTPAADPVSHRASYIAPIAAPITATIAAPDAVVSSTPAGAPARRSRTPALIGGGVLVLAALAYAATRGSGRSDTGVASGVSTPSPAASGADSLARAGAGNALATDSPLDTTAAAKGDSGANRPVGSGVPATAARADSGVIRIAIAFPKGTQLTLDGRAVSGRMLRVARGAHRLSVRVPGMEPLMQRVVVAGGDTVRWSPVLIRETIAAPSVSAAPAAPVESKARPADRCKSAMRAFDWSAAMPECLAAANDGDVAAASHLGRLYARGLGTAKDESKAYPWYRKAAEGGDRDAQFELASALRDGRGTRRDEKDAARWFQKAAEAGHAEAQLAFAEALEDGKGIKRDERSAREWYAKALAQGGSIAGRRLAHMYEKGDGGPKSETDAIKTYERAAELGDPESAMTVAKWYKDGRGVEKSVPLALRWFRRAAELGVKDAVREIQKLEKSGG